MWRHDFPHKSLWERSRATNSAMEMGIWPNFEPVRVLVSVIVPCKSEKEPIKNGKKPGDAIFPKISPWELLVAMVTKLLSRNTTKPDAAFPPAQLYNT